MSLSTLTSSALTIQDWQDWRRRRFADVRAEHGIAALSHAVWLDPEPQEVPGLPGRWSVVDGAAVGLVGRESYRLGIGESRRLGDRVAKVAAFRTALALRVFDPAAPSRTTLTGIDAFPHDSRWVLTGRYEAAAAGSTRPIEHHGAGNSDDLVAGLIHVELDGHQQSLVALPGEGGHLRVTFADRTNGRSSAQFRFLSVPAPTGDGAVVLDFNRAYLPPCAFSDHYLCPLPPPENRLGVAVDAGESFPERG